MKILLKQNQNLQNILQSMQAKGAPYKVLKNKINNSYTTQVLMAHFVDLASFLSPSNVSRILSNYHIFKKKNNFHADNRIAAINESQKSLTIVIQA